VDEAEAFWDFSNRLYAAPGIADACIEAQDRHGLDVNLILLCCWLGVADRGRLSAADLAAVVARLAPWRGAVVVPLRGVRRWLKGSRDAGVAALREAVKEAELAAERLAQRHLLDGLAAAGAPSGDGLADAAANLDLYFANRADLQPLRERLLQAVSASVRRCPD
jgi:uncharacterized protein (TIGR02444 family)